MKPLMLAGLAALFLATGSAQAQTPMQPQKPVPSRPKTPRYSETQRRNYAQQEAIRLLFGPQGIPALTRPSDPWNYQRPRVYYNVPNYGRYPNRLYYR